MSATAPVAVEWSDGRVDGRAGHRLMVVLAAPGCAWALRHGGCTNCAFPRSLGLGRRVETAEYAAQIEVALARIPAADPGPVQLDLFVSGSFFNPQEVPRDAQRLLLERAARDARIARVLVETRPEYVTTTTLRAALEAAQPAALEVGIGLESADRLIREERIHKGFTWDDFARAVRCLGDVGGAQLLVYVLLKPIDTAEGEAVEDAVATAERVFALAADAGVAARIALEPCFVAPDTPLAAAFAAGAYRPPWLWSVVEVVTRIAPLGPVAVGLSDEGLDPAAGPRGCEVCKGEVRRALAAFNVSGDAAPLGALDCACRAAWRAERAG